MCQSMKYCRTCHGWYWRKKDGHNCSTYCILCYKSGPPKTYCNKLRICYSCFKPLKSLLIIAKRNGCDIPLDIRKEILHYLKK